jgi:hypothetical protein
VELTAGQPWLVNALAAEMVEEIGASAPEAITVEQVEQAKERLILARATPPAQAVTPLGERRLVDVGEVAQRPPVGQDDRFSRREPAQVDLRAHRSQRPGVRTGRRPRPRSCPARR